jgi:hypothetical protein
MLPPLIASAVAQGEANALSDMAEHLQVTHKSKRLVAAARLYARVMMQGERRQLLPSLLLVLLSLPSVTPPPLLLLPLLPPPAIHHGTSIVQNVF